MKKGLLNGVTEYIGQHRRAKNQDYRLGSAWFGQGTLLKEKAFNEAMKIAAQDFQAGMALGK